MKEIVVMSGKGGTGKTTITAALGVIAGSEAVVADCDVDAANLHLLYQPDKQDIHTFKSGKTAVIDQNMCTQCGICMEKCRFDAIRPTNGTYMVDEVDCEGCSVCYHLCPESAITMEENHAGDWFISKSRFDNWFVYAKLGIGQENSGKLVSKVKDETRKLAHAKNIPFILVDGPPGIGCPVISSFSGIRHVLIITEATKAGLHDLKRLAELVAFFKAKASCVINKADLNEEMSNEIEQYCKEQKIKVINHIPFHESFYETLQQGKTLMEGGDEFIKKKIIEIWDHLKKVE